MINKGILQYLRAEYKEGDRVELINMDDIQAPPPGTKGTVWGVDDVGTIHVKWDTGSRLGVLYGVDSCRKITTEGK